ncbi:PAS domain-containing protein [bacterium]|nr:PAS domain-containing protein [bacterium]MBU1883055.1 PAS domain-containing protein [bacterium]
MEKIDTAILMKEAKFDLNELFFSITKYDSTIISGNETFVRISGYEEDEIIGRYHNIIRHQDMPKVVFKVFWDYLNANKPVVAYVKNKTKEGSYYWVFAVVFPLNDRYISIRIKPNTSIFPLVRELYFRLLMAENKLDMSESEKLLVELLNALGFRDYDHFMNEVLLAELLERKKLLRAAESLKETDDLKNGAYPDSNPLCRVSKVLQEEYAKWFDKIESFMRVKSTLEEKGQSLRLLARDIVLLSLNASVASYKLETNGETFGVLASDIRTNAKENDTLISEIHATSQALTESLNEIIFFVSYLSLQMEMVVYFIQELLQDTEKKANESIDILFELVSNYNAKLMILPYSFDKLIKRSIASLEELEQQMMYLGYVQVYGVIESARFNDDRLGFGEIFSQLKVLIAKTSDEISLMNKMSEVFLKDNYMLMNESEEITMMLERFQTEISNMQGIKG